MQAKSICLVFVTWKKEAEPMASCLDMSEIVILKTILVTWATLVWSVLGCNNVLRLLWAALCGSMLFWILLCACVLGCSVLLRVAMNCPGLLLAFLLGCSWLLCAVLDCFGQLWITLWIRCLGTWKPWTTMYVDDFVIYKYRQSHAFE